jgi:hypothetical protein
MNKLLFEELEMTTTKLEVMSGVESSTKVDESRNTERESEGYDSTGGNNEATHTHTTATGSRFHVV